MRHDIQPKNQVFLISCLAALLFFFVTGNAHAKKFRDMTDQVIVKYNDDFIDGKDIAKGLAKQINKNLRHIRQTPTGAHIYKLDAREDIGLVRGYIRAIEAIPGVAYAEPDQMMYKSLLEPNDTFYNAHQWHYHEAAGGLNAAAAWSQFSGFEGPVYVAVLDTGKTNHEDLSGNLVAGYDMINDPFVSNDGNGRDNDPSDPGDAEAANECYTGSAAYDSSWHGTHVAGTIAAATNNSIGVAGVTYNLAKIVPVRVLGKCGGYLSDIADGIRWAAGITVDGQTNQNPAQVINMSLGGSGRCSSTYQNAINAAVLAGTTVVVSAGNADTNARRSQPANCKNVVTVASTGRTGGKAYYSNYGSVVDLAAPGGELFLDDNDELVTDAGVLSTLNTGSTGPEEDTYAWYQGTSMAAPHVSGVAALMYLKNNSASAAEIEATLKSTARAFPATCSGCGAGIVDAGAAIAASVPAVPNDPPTFDESYPFINILENSASAATAAEVVDINASDPEGEPISYSLESGNTGGDFNINSTSGIITVVNSLDYERSSDYVLSVEISDGLNTAQQDIYIYIDDDPSDNDTPLETDNDGDGYFTPEDCNDNDPDVHPGHGDRGKKWGRDGIDNDCDGIADQ